MTKKIDDLEKNVIAIRKIYLNSEHSFSIKLFFTFLGIFIGFVYYIIKGPAVSLTSEDIIALMAAAVMIFFLPRNKNSSNLKRACNGMIKDIIESKNPKDYFIKPDSYWDRFIVGLTGAYFLFVVIIILFHNLLWSILISLVFAIYLFFSKFNYTNKQASSKVL